jgi:hypothetical protein
MKETERKKQIDAEWYRQYNLNQQQLTQLIAEKFERARMYQEALRKREALLVESR